MTGFWSTWSNSLYQLRLLDALLSLPSDTFNFVQLPGRRIVTVEDVVIASPTIKALAANVQGHTWNSLDLFEVLVRMADSESPDIRNCVREMLDKAIKISAELVHMGLLQVSVCVSADGVTITYILIPRLEPFLERDTTGILKEASGYVSCRASQSPACFHEDLANRADVLDECFSRLLRRESA